MNGFKRVLIANRGEIAIRIAKAASALGIESVGVHAAVDAWSLHTRLVTEARELAGDAGNPIGAYLDAGALIDIARETGCDCVHPGYGFLAENAPFAELCEANGLAFVGPGADALALFGDKMRARRLAASLDIPVVPGGGEWMIAFAQVAVPIFTVIVRRSFGVAGNNFATPRSRPSMRVAWPAADVGGIPPEGGIEAAYKRQLAEAEDPKALREELMARIESARGPLGPLSKFQMEEMIDPRDTRRLVCEWAQIAYRLATQPARLAPRAIQFRP